MKVELNQKDLIRLVQSLSPTAELIGKNQHIAEYGYTNLNGIWSWHIEELSKLNEEELYELYKLLKLHGRT